MSELVEQKTTADLGIKKAIREDEILTDLMKQFGIIGTKYNKRLAEIYRQHGLEMPEFKIS